MSKSVLIILIVLFLSLIKVGYANADSKGGKHESSEFRWNDNFKEDDRESNWDDGDWKNFEKNEFKGRHFGRERDDRDDDFEFDDHHQGQGANSAHVNPEPLSCLLFVLGGGALVGVKKLRR